VTKGIVRVDSGYMKQIGVRSGDMLRFKVVVRQSLLLIEHILVIWAEHIRMDGLIRRNSKTGISEVVIVRKANVKEAKKV